MTENQDKAAKQNFILKYLDGGVYDGLASADRFRIIVFNAVMTISFLVLFLFGIERIVNNNIDLGILDLSMAGVVFIGLVLIRLLKNKKISYAFIVTVSFCFFGYLSVFGGVQGSGILWMYSIPLLSVYMLGTGVGLSVSLLFWGGISYFFFFPITDVPAVELSVYITRAGSYFLVSTFVSAYDVVRKILLQRIVEGQRELEIMASDLQQQKKHTDLILHNASDGLFLLDRDLVFKGEYSHYLESILENTNLQGREFCNILNGVIPERDVQATRDYLQMFFSNHVNPDLLQEINPLDDCSFNFMSDDGRIVEKHLEFHFHRISDSAGEAQIFGAVKDHTKSVELQAQIKEGEARRNIEMQNLFQIIHIEPSLLHDFMEDCRLQMQQANNLLKEKDVNYRQVAVAVFQYIHSIKGDALLLGLQAVADICHAIEDELKSVIERTVVWDDMLHLTTRMAELQSMLNRMNELLEKIRSYRASDTASHLSSVVSKTIDRISRDRNKSVSLSIDNFREEHIHPEHFKGLKDILIQLSRNSMIHGIESPRVRMKSGKDSVGNITLSSLVKNGIVELHFEDDGRGLQADVIRERAMANPALKHKNPGEMTDQQVMGLIFEAGFSTVSEGDMEAGRGVGMSLVRTKVKELGGKLKIRSVPGKKCCFVIQLPQEPRGISFN